MASVKSGTNHATPADSDLDAGWEAAPESASLPLKTAAHSPAPASVPPSVTERPARASSLPPVVSAPRPRPSGRAPRAVSEDSRLAFLRSQGRDDSLTSAELAPRARSTPTIEVGDAPEMKPDPALCLAVEGDADGDAPEVVSPEGAAVVSAEVVSAEVVSAEVVSAGVVSAEELGAELLSPEVAGEDDASTEATVMTTEPAKGSVGAAGDESLAPSPIELASFRPRSVGRTAFAVFAGCAAVFVVASVAWNRASHRSEPVAERLPERAPALAPAGPSPVSVPSPATPAPATVTTTSAPAPEQPGDKSGEKATAAVTVTVTAVPKEAVIFRAGKRLGTGVVRVSVEPKVKQRFTALLDGYAPSNFALDGSRDAVTIVLKRVQKRRVTTAHESDSPYDDEPAGDATAAATPTATVAAAPESTAETAAEPAVPPSAEPSPE